MKRPFKRRCGASAPDSDARKGWHYCCYEAGHKGMHEDEYVVWRDNDTVEVRTVAEIATVHDHEHDFPQLGQDGDAVCTMDDACQLTWNEHMRQQAWWEQEQMDICGYCGHAAHCHTHEASDEGGRPYCTECSGKDEFHAMDQEPPVYTPSREQLLERLGELFGPGMPRDALEAAVDAMTASLRGAEAKG